jgi:hypothetical protein
MATYTTTTRDILAQLDEHARECTFPMLDNGYGGNG